MMKLNWKPCKSYEAAYHGSKMIGGIQQRPSGSWTSWIVGECLQHFHTEAEAREAVYSDFENWCREAGLTPAILP